MTTTGFSDFPIARRGAEFRIPWRTLFLGVVVLAVILALTGCQTFPQAEATLRTAISANKGHAADDRLPPEARTIAEKNMDLDWKVLFNIGGCEEDEIPAAVRERQAARAHGRSRGDN